VFGLLRPVKLWQCNHLVRINQAISSFASLIETILHADWYLVLLLNRKSTCTYKSIWLFYFVQHSSLFCSCEATCRIKYYYSELRRWLKLTSI